MKTSPSLSSEHVDINPTYVNLTNSCCNIDAYFAIKSLTGDIYIVLWNIFFSARKRFLYPICFCGLTLIEVGR